MRARAGKCEIYQRPHNSPGKCGLIGRESSPPGRVIVFVKHFSPPWSMLCPPPLLSLWFSVNFPKETTIWISFTEVIGYYNTVGPLILVHMYCSSIRNKPKCPHFVAIAENTALMTLNKFVERKKSQRFLHFFGENCEVVSEISSGIRRRRRLRL